MCTGAVDNWNEFIRAGQTCGSPYAESTDGRPLEKTEVWSARVCGSKDNNLCALDRECYNSPLVMYEPDEPDRSRRFKMAFVGYITEASRNAAFVHRITGRWADLERTRCQSGYRKKLE